MTGLLYFAEVVFAGFFVGVLVGATGVGGGTIMAPLLLLAFKMNPLLAVGTDLFYNAPTKIVGTIVHARQGTLNVFVTLYLTCGGLIGAVVGAIVLRNLRSQVGLAALAVLLRHWIGLAICLSALLTLVPLFGSPWFRNEKAALPNRITLIILGAVVGAIVITTSVGAGAITMALLCLLLRRSRMADLVGSDLAFSAVLTIIGSALYYSTGSVDVRLGLALVLGSVPGVIVGSRLSFRVSDRILRPAVGGVLFFIGLRLLT